MKKIEPVILNADEQALFEAIRWNAGELSGREDRHEHYERMRQLAESLTERDAIPKVRLAYFTNPKLNVGGRGKSRQQVFKDNGRTDEEILSHPTFMKYLRYFIHGPDLPKSVIEGFCKVIEDDEGTSGVVRDQLRKYVRKAIREHGLTTRKSWAEEFFKLAHEIDQSDLAETVRTAGMTA